MLCMETEERREGQVLGHRALWTAAVLISAIAVIVGIVLTTIGTAERWTPIGDGQFDVTYLAVWPAGLVLFGVGLLGLIATAIAAAVVSSKR